MKIAPSIVIGPVEISATAREPLMSRSVTTSIVMSVANTATSGPVGVLNTTWSGIVVVVPSVSWNVSLSYVVLGLMTWIGSVAAVTQVSTTDENVVQPSIGV